MRFADLIKHIDDNWSFDEIARYLYVNIGKNILYDVRFEHGTDVELLKELYGRDINVDDDIEDLRMTCRQANMIYSSLLTRCGIKSEFSYRNAGINPHLNVPSVALVYWTEDGTKRHTSIIGDITNCIHGAKTKYFAPHNHTYEDGQDSKEMLEEELKIIDDKIGYTRYGEYADLFIELIVGELKNTNNFRKFLKTIGIQNVETLSMDEILRYKLEFVSRHMKCYEQGIGANERKRFYQTLFHRGVLDCFESKKFHPYEFIKIFPNGNVDVLSCIQLDMNGEKEYYLYSEDECTYLAISEEDLVKKISNGYKEKKGMNIFDKSPNTDDIVDCR